MSTPIVWIDAFTSTPYGGNPAAVCLLSSPKPDAWMQALAAELNISETVFLLALDDGSYSLRWFTPAAEIELCGHATLASAHALWNHFNQSGETLVFKTLSGDLTAVKSEQGITLNFPEVAPTPFAINTDVADALGKQPVWSGQAGKKLFIELESAQAVRDCQPDFAAICALPLRGVVITAASDEPQYDFISRFFIPELGINEDPVTGSAHCSLAPYWAAKFNKTTLTGYQASKRGGVVKVALIENRVTLTGQCQTIFAGELSEHL